MKKINCNQNLIIAGMIFLVVFGVFVFTLAPGLYTEDSAEFVTAAATLGIPHPSGYPTYTMLGFLFSKIPLGEIPWRLNLMSAFFAALTAALLYLIIKQIGRDWSAGWKLETISILSALTFSFSQTFWRQSILTEVYSLNAFFVALTLLFLLNYYQSGNPRQLYLLALFYGLGLTNHYSLLTLGPAYFLLFFFANPNKNKLDPPIKSGDDTKTWRNSVAKQQLFLLAKCLVLFLLGLLPYLYLPLRASSSPLLNWFNPSSIQNLSQVLSFNLHPGYQLTLNTLKFLPELLNNYWHEFTWPLTLIGCFGFYFLIRKSWRLGLFFLLAFLLTNLGVIIAVTHGAPIDFFLAWFLNVLFIPHYLIFTILIAAGVFGLLKLLPPRIALLALLLLALAPLFLLSTNFSNNDRRQEFLVENYHRALLSYLPEQSILIVKENDLNEDSILFPLAYLKIAEGLRPDVTIITDTPVFKRPAELKLDPEYFTADFVQQKKQLIQLVWERLARPPHRPLFVTSPAYDLSLDLISWSNGYLYEVLPKTRKPARDFWPTLVIEETPGLQNDWSLQVLASKILYNQAAFAAQLNQKERMTSLLTRAIKLDPSPLSFRYQEFIWWREGLTPSDARVHEGSQQSSERNKPTVGEWLRFTVASDGVDPV